jgi:hypothetical protein
MSTYNYTKLQAKALALLVKFGSNVAIVNGESDTLETLQGVNDTGLGDFKPGSIVENADIAVYLPYSAKFLVVGNYFIINDETYRILKVNTFNPASNVLLYQVFGSK